MKRFLNIYTQIAVASLALVLFTASFKQLAPPTKMGYGAEVLKGHVKSSVVAFYSIYQKQGLLTQVLISRNTYQYDPQGYVQFKVSYTASGSAKDTVRYAYDFTNNIVTEKIYDSIGTLKQTTEKYYNDSGQLQRYDIIFNDGRSSTTSYGYDERGHEVWDEETRTNGEIIPGFSRRYDDHDRIIWQEAQKENGAGYFFKYDTQGREVEKTLALKDGSPIERRLTCYDTIGHVTEEEEYDIYGRLTLRNITGQKLNGITWHVNYSNERLETNSTTKETYDSTFLQLTRTTFENGHVTGKLLRQFDSNGNVVTDSMFKNGHLTHVLTQQIDYY